MAWDFKFDPVTKDLVVVNGTPQLTEAADTMVMHQDWIHFGDYWGGPHLGSLFWNLRAFGPKPEVSVPAEGMRSLKVVAARGAIAGIEVAVLAEGQGRITLARRFRDVRTNTTVSSVVRTGG
jgi:hypothetical protein